MREVAPFLVVFVALGFPVRAAVVRVDPGGGGDFTDIQAAIDAARDGDTVLVAPGEYVLEAPLDFNRLHDPDDPASPPVKDIVVRSTGGAETTILRMAPDARPAERRSVVLFRSGETAASRLDGFTLTGGRGMGGCPDAMSACGTPALGGGIFCEGASPVVSRCVITENLAQSADFGPDERARGGGVYCTAGASLVLADCAITANRAVSGLGGGVYADDGSSVDLVRCRVSGNVAWIGGGVYSGASVTLSNCEVTGNMARNFLCDFRSRCWGGGIYCHTDSTATAINCTIAGNWASPGAGVFTQGAVTLVNSIVWGPGSPIYVADIGSLAASHSSVEDRVLPGAGNLSVDPLFVASGRFEGDPFLGDVWVDGDYRLLPGSPLIDAGTREGAPADDLDGTERPCGLGVDIGAHEFCDSSRFRRGDPNADGEVNIADAVHILAFLFLGATPPSCLASADTNDDSALDLADATTVLGFLFLGDPSPRAPFPDCGTDPTVDRLSCRVFAGCE